MSLVSSYHTARKVGEKVATKMTLRLFFFINFNFDLKGSEDETDHVTNKCFESKLRWKLVMITVVMINVFVTN